MAIKSVSGFVSSDSDTGSGTISVSSTNYTKVQISGSGKTDLALKKIYDESYPGYKRLGMNIEEALQYFLNEKNIETVNINNRIKEFESFWEKVVKHNCTVPFNEIEDICGVRIICYYISDLKLIEKIIKKEFLVLESTSRDSFKDSNQFGYRSNHYIVKIKPKWLASPNYRGLENLKAEIQVRTVLMHAWAGISHKLFYKKTIEPPENLKRELSKISVILEDGDEKFEGLKKDIFKFEKSSKGLNKSKEKSN